MEDRSLNIPNDYGAVLDTGRYAGGKTPVHDVFFIVDGNFKLRAEVLYVIVI